MKKIVFVILLSLFSTGALAQIDLQSGGAIGTDATANSIFLGGASEAGGPTGYYTGTRVKNYFDTLYLGITGEATTAAALAADPDNCAAGTVALGVTADGTAECSATPSLQALTLTGTNTLSVGTSSSSDGSILFKNATNANAFTIVTGATGAAIGWTLPTAAPGGANYLLNVDADGTMGYTDPSGFSGIDTGVSVAPQCGDGAGRIKDCTNVGDAAYMLVTDAGDTDCVLTRNGSGVAVCTTPTPLTTTVNWIIPDPQTTGNQGCVTLGVASTITAATLVCNASDSITVDVWGDAYADGYPTAADTITASATPALSSATQATDSTLTGWTTAVGATDWLCANVESAGSSATNCTLTLTVTQ